VTRTADAVVVGGGVTGVSVAYQLAARGPRHVVVL
jgi:glycine/D-amino acid oxidase-like deaminating enzyme